LRLEDDRKHRVAAACTGAMEEARCPLLTNQPHLRCGVACVAQRTLCHQMRRMGVVHTLKI
jgi:hypothetical protein